MYKQKIMNLIIRIDKMSSTEIKEELAEVALHIDNDNVNFDLQNTIQNNKSCCMPSICTTNCGDCSVDIDVEVTVQHQDDDPPKRCPFDCRKK